LSPALYSAGMPFGSNENGPLIGSILIRRDSPALFVEAQRADNQALLERFV
jgi:hypothetical protein